MKRFGPEGALHGLTAEQKEQQLEWAVHSMLNEL